jgi:hypothetical protein
VRKQRSELRSTKSISSGYSPSCAVATASLPLTRRYHGAQLRYQQHFKRLFAIMRRCDGLIATDPALSRGAAPLYQQHFRRLFAIMRRCDGLVATDPSLSRGAAPLYRSSVRFTHWHHQCG